MLFPLAIIVGVGSLVCWILVLVKIFQANQIGLGILGIICPLFTFIYGWVKSGEWKIQKLMLIWTVLVVINIALSAAMPHTVIIQQH